MRVGEELCSEDTNSSEVTKVIKKSGGVRGSIRSVRTYLYQTWADFVELIQIGFTVQYQTSCQKVAFLGTDLDQIGSSSDSKRTILQQNWAQDNNYFFCHSEK